MPRAIQRNRGWISRSPVPYTAGGRSTVQQSAVPAAARTSSPARLLAAYQESWGCRAASEETSTKHAPGASVAVLEASWPTPRTLAASKWPRRAPRTVPAQ